MRKQDLKVGMSFDVVYILKSMYGKGTFSPKRTTIMLDGFAVPNSDYYRSEVDGNYNLNIFNRHYGSFNVGGESGIKKVAKLTITKLNHEKEQY